MVHIHFLASNEQVELLRLVLDNVGIYLNELQVKLQEIFGVIVSPPTICRTLKKIGCSRRVGNSTYCYTAI